MAAASGQDEDDIWLRNSRHHRSSSLSLGQQLLLLRKSSNQKDPVVMADHSSGGRESGSPSQAGGSSGGGEGRRSSEGSEDCSTSKPHMGNDARWKAIREVVSRDGDVGVGHFMLQKKLGCGDIGSVYLAELRGTRCSFAMKIMNKEDLERRKKLARAQTERDILGRLDHPFLPTLYSHFETEQHSCLVMDYCSGGDLHALRQGRPGKCFSEQAARFYGAEIVVALEYLHMLGIVYRDLKPENVLLREDGHIMLSDFDLSLCCTFSPTLITNTTHHQLHCINNPACFTLTRTSRRRLVPELSAEPTAARSMSFVGTHEYLAPEMVKGEGHGSAVDWWTLGIFLYELLFGKTPFKGSENRATLFNVVCQPLTIPETPATSFAAKDLIRRLLVKDPHQRLAYKRGATEIKHHPFFHTLNWALIRCASPPDLPNHPPHVKSPVHLRFF